jgi:hypothetical protein
LRRKLHSIVHNQRIGSLSRGMWQRHGNSYNLTMSVNGASTILGPISTLIWKGFARCCPYATYKQPFYVRQTTTGYQPHSGNERQQSVNDFGCCILYNPRNMVLLWHIIKVLAAVIGNMVNVAVATAEDEHQQSIKRVSTECQWFWVMCHV